MIQKKRNRRLAEIPRVRLAQLPTPIEALHNLSADVGGAMLYAKHDDNTGLAFGGNKVRQLEFYLGEALEQSADTVLITGAVQSNFVRLTAAAAAKLGLKCHIQLEERVSNSTDLYRTSGNVLLDRLLGATLSSYPDGEDEVGADRRLHEIAGEMRRKGAKPYVIPLAAGHPPLGALGYVLAAAEILEQIGAADLRIGEIVVASGSGNTHGGLLFGVRALGSSIRVTGVCVRRGAELQQPRIRQRCNEIADLLEVESRVEDEDVVVVDKYLPPGYGKLNRETLTAVALAAQREGLILDPVYTGKTMAAALDRARESDPAESLLFVHTGGTPALFAYGSDIVG